MMYRSFLSVIFATNLGMVASAFLGQNAAMFKVHLKATPSAMNPEEKINLKRAKDCAEHFGKCSPKEVETLRDALHQKRVRHMILANMMGTIERDDSTTEASDMEQRLLEEDLSLQLKLLKLEMTPNKLFVEDEKTQSLSFDSLIVPQALNIQKKKSAAAAEPPSTWMMLDEGTTEAALFCAALGIMFMMPQKFLEV